MINTRKKLAAFAFAGLAAANFAVIIFSAPSARAQTTQENLTINPTLLTEPDTFIKPALTTTIIPSSDLFAPTITTPPADTTETAGTGTTDTTGTGTTDTGAATTGTGDTTTAGTTGTDVTGRTGDTGSTTGTAADSATGREAETVMPDLSGLVEMDTIKIGPLDATEETSRTTEETGEACAAPAAAGAGCITPAEAVDYAAPQIIGGQAKIAAVVLLSTVIGLILTVLVSYLLNNFRGRRDLERIKNEESKYIRKFAANQINQSSPELIEALASVINKTQSGKPFTAAESSLIQKELSRLGLFGSPQTSAAASRLLTLLNQPGAHGPGAQGTSSASKSTAGSNTPAGAVTAHTPVGAPPIPAGTTPTDTRSEIARTAQELSNLLKKDLGL